MKSTAKPAKKTATKREPKLHEKKPQKPEERRAKESGVVIKRVKAKARKQVKGSSARSSKQVRQTLLKKERTPGTRRRLPPPEVDMKLAEVMAADPDDPRFRHPSGRPRTYNGQDPKTMNWRDAARLDKQKRSRQRKAKIRKQEVAIVTAERELQLKPGGPEHTVDDRLVADFRFGLDDWDDEELARGYRKNRNGRFGNPPKYIPREVQQEAMRRIVKKHKELILSSFVKATEELVKLAKNSDSDKVKLDAIKELVQRVVGKVPDKMIVSADETWQDFLFDSVAPTSTVSQFEAFPEDVVEGETVEEGAPVEPAELAAVKRAAPGASQSHVRGRPPGQDDNRIPDVAEW